MLRTDKRLVVFDASVNTLVSAHAELLYAVTRWCLDHDITIDHVRRLEETPLGTVNATVYVLSENGNLLVDPTNPEVALTKVISLVPRYLLPDPQEFS